MTDRPESPAAAGGTPARTRPFAQEQRYGEEELQELREALAQGTLFYAHGGKVRQLEEEFARANGVGYAVACSSGTAAIHAALIAAEISPGDEVITSPITDMGTVIPILFQGAIPVFADLHPHSYTLLPEAVEAAITPRTRAVLAVHLWGNACDLDALQALCDRRGLVLIEDCAQALGCAYRGRPIGTIGSMGCFSLNEFKHISCGDGGLLITDDPALAAQARLATDKGYSRDAGAASRNPAFLCGNYRLTELQGAVALAQFRKLGGIVERRRRWCRSLSEKLEGLPGLRMPQPTPGCDPSWWFFMMRVAPEELHADADRLTALLQAEKLPVSAHYIGKCLYEYPIFTGHSAFPGFRAEPQVQDSPAVTWPHPYCARPYHKGLCPTAEAILSTCVILRINEAYDDLDLEETAHVIRRAVLWLAGQG